MTLNVLKRSATLFQLTRDSDGNVSDSGSYEFNGYSSNVPYTRVKKVSFWVVYVVLFQNREEKA